MWTEKQDFHFIENLQFFSFLFFGFFLPPSYVSEENDNPQGKLVLLNHWHLPFPVHSPAAVGLCKLNVVVPRCPSLTAPSPAGGCPPLQACAEELPAHPHQPPRAPAPGVSGLPFLPQNVEVVSLSPLAEEGRGHVHAR